jgi:hypothetical protein
VVKADALSQEHSLVMGTEHLSDVHGLLAPRAMPGSFMAGGTCVRARARQTSEIVAFIGAPAHSERWDLGSDADRS